MDGSQGSGIVTDLTRLKNRIDTRLNNHLCEMKEGYDDSIVGFNEAWDIVRAVIAEEMALLTPAFETSEVSSHSAPETPE
jgi:hypothetical protein